MPSALGASHSAWRQHHRTSSAPPPACQMRSARLPCHHEPPPSPPACFPRMRRPPPGTESAGLVWGSHMARGSHVPASMDQAPRMQACAWIVASPPPRRCPKRSRTLRPTPWNSAWVSVAALPRQTRAPHAVGSDTLRRSQVVRQVTCPTTSAPRCGTEVCFRLEICWKHGPMGWKRKRWASSRRGPRSCQNSGLSLRKSLAAACWPCDCHAR
mmetsp:Transcript_144950/g.403725  ORF Transcript_144950/g.403725 Transcript_144950/m.403725 type:complete len:213 (-) Transcript_144950:638-1276(-)